MEDQPWNEAGSKKKRKVMSAADRFVRLNQRALTGQNLPVDRIARGGVSKPDRGPVVALGAPGGIAFDHAAKGRRRSSLRKLHPAGLPGRAIVPKPHGCEHCLRGFTNRDIRAQLAPSVHLRTCRHDPAKQSAKVSEGSID